MASGETKRPRVLFLTYHFPPSAASGTFRLLGFAKYLPALGWDVSVVAPPEMPWEPVDSKLSDQVPPEVEVRSVPYPKNAWKVTRRFFPLSVWLPHAWRETKRLIAEHRPDIMMTSGPPHVVHFLGMWAKKKFSIPWIADFRDPWVKDGLGKPITWKGRWFLYWERRVYRLADRILANAPNAQGVYRKEYPEHAAKIDMLTNGFDPGLAEAPPRTAPANLVRMIHAGEIYWGRDPMPLFDAMQALRKTPPVAGMQLQLEILGRSEIDREKLDQEIARRGLSDAVVFRGQVPYRESIREMYGADVNVLFDTPNRTFGVPAKLYEYFGAGRPILALAESHGDTAAVLRASGLLHRIVHPKNAAEIQAGLADLMVAISKGEPVSSRPEALERFTRQGLTRRLAEIMDEVLARK